jgi:hypothetical protein
MRESNFWKAGFVLVIALALAAMPALAGGVAEMLSNGSSVSFVTDLANDGMTLKVDGPNGFHFEQSFKPGTEATMGLFDRAGYALPDGRYTWELSLNPVLPAGVRQALADARAQGDDSLGDELRAAGILPRQAQAESGTFTILDGALVDGRLVESRNGGSEGKIGTVSEGQARPTAGLKDQVISDDLIVDGSICTGFDCVNGENFGADTLRLKENNLRIHFDDTSNSGSFPNVDWRLTANDTTNGGANKFTIDDATNGKVPFTIQANAPTNSLFVESTGDIGVNTSNPVVELHIVDGDSPTVRLEQNGSSGFTPQTWDMAGNETNFFVRDVTNGSKLPFKIRPGAPDNSVYINTNGDVGIGTSSPSRQLHVKNNDGDTRLFVEETSSTESARNLVVLENNGDTQMLYRDTSADGDAWQLSNFTGGFNISLQGSGVTEFQIADNGDVFINNGTVQVTSSRTMKENFVPADPLAVLQAVNAMPMTSWNYKKDEATVRHLGPMAEDFYGTFGLGTDDKHITVGDTSGVALAAIQGLSQLVDQKDQRISDLEQRLAALEKLIQQQ